MPREGEPRPVQPFADIARWIDPQEEEGHALLPRLLQCREPMRGLLETGAELAAERALSHDKGADGARSLEWKAAPGSLPLVLLAWAVVVVPLAWGVWVTLQKTAVLFH